MKMFFPVCCVVLLACGVVMAQLEGIPHDMHVIDIADEVIVLGSEDCSSLAQHYAANNTSGSTCTGPAMACGVSPSPDCDLGFGAGPGDCTGISSLTAPTCVASTSWIFIEYCYQNGVECQNGTCANGWPCQNSMSTMCSSGWGWFW